MPKLQLFQVAAILHPEGDRGDSELILEPEFKMAVSDKVAAQLVVRSLDEQYEAQLDRVDILVRPF